MKKIIFRIFLPRDLNLGWYVSYMWLYDYHICIMLLIVICKIDGKFLKLGSGKCGELILYIMFIGSIGLR